MDLGSIPHEFLLASGEGKSMHEWNIRLNRIERMIHLPIETTGCVNFTKYIDEDNIIISSETQLEGKAQYLAIYNIKTKKYTNEIFTNNKPFSQIWDVDYRKRENFIALSCWDQYLRILNLEGKEMECFEYNAYVMFSVFSKKYNNLFFGGGETIVGIDLAKMKKTFNKMEKRATKSLDICPQKSEDVMLFTSSKKISFLDLRTKKEASSLNLYREDYNYCETVCRISPCKPVFVFIGINEGILVDERMPSKILLRKNHDSNDGLNDTNYRLKFIGEEHFAFCGEQGENPVAVLDYNLKCVRKFKQPGCYALSYLPDDLNDFGVSRLIKQAREDRRERIDYVCDKENKEILNRKCIKIICDKEKLFSMNMLLFLV